MRLLLALLFFVCSAQAATLNWNGTVADFATQLAAAAEGDTILATSGATWASGITISGKGVTVDFGGFTITRGATTATLISITIDATNFTRLTNGTISNSASGSSGNNRALTIDGGFDRQKFRVDNMTFSSTADSTIHIVVYQAWGLIDNCTLSGDDGSEMIHNEAWGAPSPDTNRANPGWDETITPGSADALYIETTTFSKSDQTDSSYWGTSGHQSYYGARSVIRYCIFNYCMIDVHGGLSANNIGARWYELYANDFHLPTNGGAGQNQSDYIGLRAGSGVVFDNTKSGGPNSGSGNIALVQEVTSGYPALWQIGRGKATTYPPVTGSDLALDPLYCWDNTADSSIAGQATYIVEARDFYANTEKPGYTPYTYPYPWGGGGSAGGTATTGKVSTSGKVTIQ